MVNHSNVIAVHQGNKVIPLKSGPALAEDSLSVSIATDSGIIGSTQDAGYYVDTPRAVTISADLSTIADVTPAPAAGETLVITDIIVSADTEMDVVFTEETSGTVITKVFITVGGIAQITPRGKLKLDTADKKLRATASVAGNIAITILYYSE